ncbi:methyltransferase [Danxiaibacter flavus]|uniref:tRNA1(Val) (adenine(37)-N6)-methyltransferase n=1 Tax=Danxiaibacter flavus TaxID=3049108 RepID=A0ABV3ZL43_9BACT|nr:methyltransferase [Chitinophagaceae bacterium DXS]
MPNHFFKFKQFTVYQDKCAMKVCTDACLFGGWLANKADLASGKHVLDIGAGTGLLSLMLAQKLQEAKIDAVEIDLHAAEQARENFGGSDWSARLNLINMPVQELKPEIKYDLIISNPPFFENDLKSNDHKRNLALHSTALGLDELFDFVNGHLDDNGSFAVLIPYHRTQECLHLASQRSFHLAESVLVKQTPRHDFFRSMLLFRKQPSEAVENVIVIKDASNAYTDEFVGLLKNYYLHL